MTIVPAKTPVFVKSVFSSFVWNIPTEKPEIYLTFDDGPTPKITAWVLEQLKVYNAKATFFCIGHNIEKHPDIFQQVLDDGHSIGNHTFNHLNGWKTSTETYLDNVAKCLHSLQSKIGAYPSENTLFRPPYGKLKPKQAKRLQQTGYNIIMWDVLSFDWDKRTSPNLCLNNVLKNTTKGSIVVFHDSLKASKNLQYVLPKVLEHFSKKGFQFKSL